MKIDTQSQDGLRRVAEKIEGMRVAMLTLRENGASYPAVADAGAGEEEWISRPLTPLLMDNAGCIWFFTSHRTMQPLLGTTGQNANLAFSDEGSATYVSMSGRADLRVDLALQDQLWTAMAKPWFPDGPTDPDLALLKFTPRRADLWNGPNSTLLRMAALAASVVASKPVGLGDHEVIEASRGAAPSRPE
jgi:general stress protein 26